MMRIKTNTLIICLLLSVLGLASQFYIGRLQTQMIQQMVKDRKLHITAPNNFQSLAGRQVAAMIQSPFVIIYDHRQARINPSELASWVEPYQQWYSGNIELRPQIAAIEDYVRALAPSLSIPPTDATLAFRDGQLMELQASSVGSQIHISQAVADIAQAMMSGQHEVVLPMEDVPAKISLLTARELGIQELIGSGSTSFAGSPYKRTRNIILGAQKMNSIILAPGASFSFNTIVGRINAAAGYLPSKVIKNGTFVTEYGGGLCQVSTTMFRAVMYAGLEILERHGHALPVSYYNPQGFDATIYPGIVDLRFKNNTPGYILIQSIIANKKLTYEIYGTRDSRRVIIIPPHVSYTRANGSFGTVLTRTIIDATGASKSEQFFSFYRPAAVAPELKNPLE